MTSKRCQHTVNGVTLDLHPGTLALRRLAVGRRCWADNGGEGARIWRLHVADAAGRRIDLDGAAAERCLVRAQGTQLTLIWRGVRDPASGAGPFDVRVEIRPSPAGDHLTAWRLKVTNRSAGWTLWSVRFPCLTGIGAGRDPDADAVFWPEVWGMRTVGWRSMTAVSGPCGGYGKHAMQFIGMTRDGYTLYLGAHDPGQCQKHMSFDPGVPGDSGRRQAGLDVLAHPSGMTEAGNGYEPDYDIVVGEIRGDWFDASRIYAGWARQQAWAAGSGGVKEGHQTGAEYRSWRSKVRPSPFA